MTENNLRTLRYLAGLAETRQLAYRWMLACGGAALAAAVVFAALAAMLAGGSSCGGFVNLICCFKLAVFTLVMLVAAGFAGRLLAGGIGQELAAEWTRELLFRLLYAQGSSGEQKPQGELLAGLAYTAETAARGYSETLPRAAFWAISAAVFGLGAVSGGAVFALLGFAGLGLAWPLLRFLFARDEASAAFRAARQSELLGRGCEVLRRLEFIKACGREEAVLADSEAVLRRGPRFLWPETAARFAADWVLPAALVLLALLALSDVSFGPARKTLPFFAVFMIFLEAFALKRLAQLTPRVSRQFTALRGLEDLFKQYSQAGRRTGKPLILAGGEIALCGVRLESGARAVFSNLTLKIPTGRHIAVAGAPESGKTAFVRMLAQLAVPQAGSILLDGQNIYEISLASFRGKVAFVPETPDIFTGTLGENISFGSSADEAGILAAAELAGLNRLISELPGGLNEPVSHATARLTSSIRARMMLARALCRRPRILVLDSVTAFLSENDENYLFAALRRALPGLTIISVATRRASLAGADYVCALKGQGDVALYPAASAGAQAFADQLFGLERR